MIIITGGTSGIGAEIVKSIIENGAIVIFTGRSEKKALRLIKEIIEEKANEEKTKIEKRLIFKKLDLSDLSSVEEFGNWFVNQSGFTKINQLYLNAGSWNPTYEETEAGYEKNFGINYLAHFYLLDFLYPKLINTDKHRVIITSSSLQQKIFVKDFDVIDLEAEMKKFGKAKSYGKSKLAKIMMVHALKLKAEERDIEGKYFSFNPGQTKTAVQEKLTPFYIFRILFAIGNKIYIKTPYQAAQTAFQLCYDNYENLKNGGYYGNSKIKGYNKLGRDVKSVKDLWNSTIELLEKQEKVFINHLKRFN